MHRPETRRQHLLTAGEAFCGVKVTSAVTSSASPFADIRRVIERVFAQEDGCKVKKIVIICRQIFDSS